MKFVIAFLFLIPNLAFCQDIKCINTVMIDGYFLKFRNKNISPKAFEADSIFFYFLPASEAKGKSLQIILKKFTEEESDSVKFLSYRPTKKDPINWDKSCKSQFDKVLSSIHPFANKSISHRINKKYDVMIRYAKVEWLHLVVKDKIACNYQYDNPPTLNCSSAKSRFFDIYLPMKILQFGNDVRVVRGVLK